MNIVIANDSPTAMFYIRLCLARVMTTLGHNVTIWDITKKSAFDCFDELKPDLIFLQSYNLTPAVVKCIKEHPELKIVMRVSDWSEWRDNLDRKYPVLKAGGKEIKLMEELQKLPNKMVCHIHHFPEYLEMTHGNWIKNGYNLIAVPNCADIFDYTNGQVMEEFQSDCTIIGGVWGYKEQTIKRYIFPLLSSSVNLNIKLFGNQVWPSAKYCGFLPNGIERHVLKSARICLNIHEPHSQDFGYDAITRPYNCLANKCFVISDYVEGLSHRLQGMIHSHSPKEYKEAINYYLDKPAERQKIAETGYNEVIQKHTGYERVALIFKELDIPFDTNVKGKILEKLCQ